MKKFYFILFFILLVANFLIYQSLSAPRILEVTILEVGEKGLPAGRQGNAILIRTPNNKTLLIDTGPDASILRALGAALSMWQRRIDAVVLTSEKASSVGGLPDVTSRYYIPTPIHFGTAAVPYGTRLAFDSVSVAVLYADLLNISYGSASFSISSTTPKGTYISDGKIMTKTK